jgi:Tfp pilus assembly protein PilO
MLAALYVAVAAPLLALYADNAALIDNRQMLLFKLNAIAQELPNLRARVAEMRSAATSDKITLEGDSDAIALATLQGRIEGLAATAGVTIGSTESLQAEPQGAYRRLGLRLVLNGTYEALVKLLARLETATPPLVVDNVQLHSFQRRPTAPTGAIDASVEVYAFRADEKPAGVAKR